MNTALSKALLSFVKFVVYTTATAMLAGFTDQLDFKALGVIAGVAAFKAALTWVTVNCKGD